MGSVESEFLGRLARLPVRYLLIAGALLLLLWFGLKVGRLFQAASSLQAWQAEAEAMLAAGIGDVDPEQAEQLIAGVRQDVSLLKSELRPFLPITRLLGWVPRVGATLEVAPELLELADAGTEAAFFTFRGLKPGLAMVQSGAGTPDTQMAGFVSLLADAEGDLAHASRAFERVRTAREKIGDRELAPARLESLMSQLDQALPLAEAGLELLRVAPRVMGAEGDRRYLIVVQNEDELRPTGGFVTGVGLLTLRDGEIAALDFEDANLVNDWREKPYDLPPRPLYYFMGLELFLFRDANFWPDFPTSAETAMALYEYGKEAGPLDGAISIDQRFMELLVAALGPLNVPGFDEPVDSGNVIQRFQEARSFQGEDESGNLSEWFRARKEFMGTFAAALLDRVVTGLGDVDPLLLAQNLWDAVQGKHLQIYVRDPEASVALRKGDADGRLAAPAGSDLLMVVDSNMGYNKANLLVDRRYSYHVDLSTEGEADVELTVHYTHRGAPLGRPCRVEDGFLREVVIDYTLLSQLCYWNYLRVYTPAGSQLLEWSKHPVPAESILVRRPWDGNAVNADDLPGLNVFANYLLLPAAEELESWFKYKVPREPFEADGEAGRYELLIVKQAGTRPEPVEVQVVLPVGSSLITSRPAPAQLDGSQLDFEIILEKDTLVSVTYR